MRLEINARRNPSFSASRSPKLSPKLRAVRRRVDSPLLPRILRVRGKSICQAAFLRGKYCFPRCLRNPLRARAHQILRSGKRKIIVCLPHARAVIYRWQRIVDDNSQLSRCKVTLHSQKREQFPECSLLEYQKRKAIPIFLMFSFEVIIFLEISNRCFIATAECFVERKKTVLRLQIRCNVTLETAFGSLNSRSNKLSSSYCHEARKPTMPSFAQLRSIYRCETCQRVLAC